MKKTKKTLHFTALSRGLLLREDTPFAIKEAYFRLRTNLTFCVGRSKAQPSKTFVVTSANTAEGKSVVTANVALSFAMLGKKTLILDCDMRKPTQAKLWNVKVSCGVAEHLAKIGKLEICKVEGELPLYLAACNGVPNNPTAMLSSESMKEMLETFASDYDYIFIDTPPINTMADAQILAPMVDGVLLVAKAGYTTRDNLALASRLIQQSGGNLCGVALNQVEDKTSGSWHDDYAYAHYQRQ